LYKRILLKSFYLKGAKCEGVTGLVWSGVSTAGSYKYPDGDLGSRFFRNVGTKHRRLKSEE
jgi:hypothetical protein